MAQIVYATNLSSQEKILTHFTLLASMANGNKVIVKEALMIKLYIYKTIHMLLPIPVYRQIILCQAASWHLPWVCP